MTSFLRVCLWVSLSALVSVGSASGQAAPARVPDSTPPPAHLSQIEGQVSLEREGRSETAAQNSPLLDGDRIRTDRGRAEVILGDGSLLLIDEATTADLLAGDLVRLIQGRLTLLVAGASDPSRAVRYQVDAPSASMQSNGPGEYRVMIDPSTGPPAVEVSVVRGDATLANDAGSIGLRAGERSRAREGEAPSRPQPFNSARSTDFDRWSAARRDARVGTTSARYLPPNLEPYAASFDRYGTWRYEASNGYVWFPTVESQWRPYSVGYWRQYDRWDSFWIAGDPWGWPTHHYGRWGFSTGYGWYWMPARSWGAGFVYWALGGDYVSWCPLGWNDYPVFGSWGVPGAYVGLYDGWYGWTVISRRHFGSSHYASRVAVDGRRFDHRTSSSFTASRRSPTLGYAVPRGQSGTAAPRMGTNGPAGGSRGVDGTGIGGRLRERSAALQSPRTTSQGRAEPAQQGAQRSSPGATLERSGQRSAPEATPRAPMGGSTPGYTQPTPRRAFPEATPRAPMGGSAPGYTQPTPRQAFPEATPRAPMGGSTPGYTQPTPRRAFPEATPRAPMGGSTPGYTQPTPRRAFPETTPRAPMVSGEGSASRRSSSSWAPSAQRPSAQPTPRFESRTGPSMRSWSTPAPSAEPRSTSRPSMRSTPQVASPRASSDAAPSRRSSTDSGTPSSRYNSGSSSQRSSDRGTSSPRHGRGGAPE